MLMKRKHQVLLNDCMDIFALFMKRKDKVILKDCTDIFALFTKKKIIAENGLYRHLLCSLMKFSGFF